MPDVLLVDLHLPDGSGLDLLKELEASPATEVVLITGHASVDTAVEALRRGARPTTSPSRSTSRGCGPCSPTSSAPAS